MPVAAVPAARGPRPVVQADQREQAFRGRAKTLSFRTLRAFPIPALPAPGARPNEHHQD